MRTETETVIRIPAPIRDAMIDHAVAELPNEACGYLAGLDGEVRRFVPVRNKLESPVGYEMDSVQQLRAEDQIEEAGLRIVGIFHSHPSTEAFPSATDCERTYFPGSSTDGRYALVYPDALRVIVSLRDRTAPELRAFRIVQEVVIA